MKQWSVCDGVIIRMLKYITLSNTITIVVDCYLCLRLLFMLLIVIYVVDCYLCLRLLFMLLIVIYV